MDNHQKIQYAILHNPTLIPKLLRDSSIPRGWVYRELRKAVPIRIGIEWELAGRFATGWSQDHKELLQAPPSKDTNIKVNGISTDRAIQSYYKVFEVRSDGELTPDPNNPPIEEVRVSIKDFHQLAGLYRFMQDMPKYCRLHEGGGIHIHMDMTMYDLNDNNDGRGFTSSKKKINEVQKYTRKQLNKLQAIFPKYTGKFNKKRVGVQGKSTWLNYSSKNTIEVRIAPLTFDYHTLMTWIVKLIKFRQDIIKSCNLVVKDKLAEKRGKKLPKKTKGISTHSYDCDRIYWNIDNNGSVLEYIDTPEGRRHILQQVETVSDGIERIRNLTTSSTNSSSTTISNVSYS